MVSHYNDVIMSVMASQIKSICSPIGSCADQRKHQSSDSLAFVRGIHQWPVNSTHRASNAENVSIWLRHHVLWESERAHVCSGLRVLNF